MSRSSVRPARVVAIGASAGGLEALERLLAHLKPRSGLAIIETQHRTTAAPSLLPELIQRYTRTEDGGVVRIATPGPGATFVPTLPVASSSSDEPPRGAGRRVPWTGRR